MAFLTGIVEGFYGREWTWEVRRDYAQFLLETGLNSYLYCPKADSFLRRRWWQPWPPETLLQLRHMAEEYRQKKLNWGVGLSPYALYQDYSGTARKRLRDKLQQLDDLGGNLLAILFDDMPGDCPDLALRQTEILTDVQNWSACEHLLVCPTYYSFDPQLERHFGTMPENYWSDLGSGLPGEVHIMWTGNEVCSTAIGADDIVGISNLLARKPVLWDNYPVNDGERASNFLHLQPLPGREPGLVQQVAGHFCNPMNQAHLSRYPLAGLAQLYGGAKAIPEDFFSAQLCSRLRADHLRFEQVGLLGMELEEREQLATAYDILDDSAAREIAEWLRGGYRFDPSCLTN